MKNLLLIIVISLFSIGTYAQGNVIFRDSNQVDFGDTLIISHDIADASLPESFVIKGYVSNISAKVINVKIRRVIIQYLYKSADEVCWANYCQTYNYKKLDKETGAQTLVAGENVSLADANVFHYLHKDQIGSTILRYYLVNDDDIVEDSLVVIYKLTGPKVTLTFNLDLSGLTTFDPEEDKVYVKGSFTDDSIQLVTWDNINYWVSTPVDFNSTYTYQFSTKSGIQSVKNTFEVADSNISVNANFETVGVRLHPSQPLFSLVYPNPATNYLNISYNLLNGQPTQVIVTDIAGRSIIKKELTNTSGTIELDLTLDPSGIYFVNLVQNGNVIVVQKFIKR